MHSKWASMRRHVSRAGLDGQGHSPGRVILTFRGAVVRAMAMALLWVTPGPWGGPAYAQAPAGAAGKSHLQRILETGTLRVGTTGDFRPMSFRDTATNDYAGYDIEAAKELAK